jgi:hypothetical protein
MKWFGQSWGAPICTTVTHVATPVDTCCARCDLAIESDDQGLMIPNEAGVLLSFHLTCFLHAVGSGYSRLGTGRAGGS